MSAKVAVLIMAGSVALSVSLNSADSSGTLAGNFTNLPTDSIKPELRELAKLPGFTNSVGVVMVRVSPGFWAGKFHVTQEQYKKVMGANPSRFAGDGNPVDSVSWIDAVAFCERLTKVEDKEKMLPAGYVYSLPTQAEWESLVAGASLNDAVTSLQGNRSGPALVGSKGPNAKGLHDIRGNLWQWCLDPQDKPYRVLRGGAWDTAIETNMRPDFHWYSKGPGEAKDTFGFRCVLKRAG